MNIKKLLCNWLCSDCNKINNNQELGNTQSVQSGTIMKDNIETGVCYIDNDLPVDNTPFVFDCEKVANTALDMERQAGIEYIYEQLSLIPNITHGKFEVRNKNNNIYCVNYNYKEEIFFRYNYDEKICLYLCFEKNKYQIWLNADKDLIKKIVCEYLNKKEYLLIAFEDLTHALYGYIELIYKLNNLNVEYLENKIKKANTLRGY